MYIAFAAGLQAPYIATRTGQMAIPRSAYEPRCATFRNAEAALDRDRPRVTLDDPSQVTASGAASMLSTP